MKKKTKKRLLYTFLILTPLLVFGFWPLTSPKHQIVFEQDKIDARKAFLAKKQAHTDSTPLPNIIIILADDLSKMDVSLYGGKNVKTTHIDAIGKNGVQFEEGYISSPICAPSRAGMLTGRYQQRFGFEANIHERYPKNRIEYFVYKNFIATQQWQVAEHEELAVPSFEEMHKQGLPPTEFLLPEVLKTKGYATACFGKWHLGYNETAIPNNRGFDYQYGFYEAFSLFAPEDKEGIINQRLTDFSDPFIWQKGRTGNCAIRRNNEVITEETYLTTKIAEETNQWIEEHKDEPFFAYVPFSAPHTPFQATKEYYDQYTHVKDPKKRVYYAMIHALDDAVGSITKKVDDLGLAENTIIFFLSDNGGATYTLAADNSPLKGGKMTNFEGGINVPFMIQWKGTIPVGTSYTPPVSALDIFKTTLANAKCAFPENQELDGVDIMPYLLDSTYANKIPHEALFWRAAGHRAVRKGEWKLIEDKKSGSLALYNMTTDKYEKTNLAAEKPKIVKKLQAEFDTWNKKMINPRWPRVMDFEYKDGEALYYFPL